MRKELPQELLRELLKNSKQSDRGLAKVLKVSQPTVTRARNNLERNGMIRDYTIIPNFKKMGFGLLALTFGKTRPGFFTPEKMKEARKDAAKFPEVIYVSLGEGLGMNLVIISLNKNYAEYHNRLNRMRFQWKDFIEHIESFVVPIGESEFKRFSLSYLKDIPL